jgi:ankyrin repeat protein
MEAAGSALFKGGYYYGTWEEVNSNDFLDKLVIECAKKNYLESLKSLVSKVENPVTLNKALLGAASTGNTEACKVLIENKADVHFVSKDSYMPSIVALKNGHTDTAKLLEHELLAGDITFSEGVQEISQNLLHFEVASALSFAGKLFDSYTGLNFFNTDSSEA